MGQRENVSLRRTLRKQNTSLINISKLQRSKFDNPISAYVVIIVRIPHKANEKEQIHSPKEKIYILPRRQIRSRLCRQCGRLALGRVHTGQRDFSLVPVT